jgi:Fe2+ transport system protein FeoA
LGGHGDFTLAIPLSEVKKMPFFSRKSLNSDVCISDHNGRILNYDHYGRSFRLLPFKQPTGVRQVSVLSELKVGQTGMLVALDLPESVQNHLMHMGFVPDALVTTLRRAPAGDPTVYCIDGMEIALRHETAEAIRVRTPRVDELAGLEGSGVEAHNLIEPDFIEADLIEAAP